MLSLQRDCGPFLCIDPEKKIIGAAHAGWRGAFSNIIENLVTHMVALGASRKHLYASLGPTILQKNYEVDEKFRDKFLKDNSQHAKFFVANRKERFIFDLPSFIAFKAMASKIKHMDFVGLNTFGNALFYSCRSNKMKGIADYGRTLSAIMLTS